MSVAASLPFVFGGFLLLASDAWAVGPTVSYAPAPDSYGDCQAASSANAVVEFDFSAGGNCTPGMPCNFTATSQMDGGTAAIDRTVLSCENQVLNDGNPTAVNVEVVGQSPIVFFNQQAGSATFAVTCTPSGANTVARICCTEGRGPGVNSYPFWDVDCPLPPSAQPEFASAPAAGEVIALQAFIGASASTPLMVSNSGPGTLLATATGLSAPLAVTPAGEQSIAASGSLQYQISCTPTADSTESRMLSVHTNDQDEEEVRYDVRCTGIPAAAPQAPELVADPSPPGPLSITTTQPAQGTRTFTLRNDGTAPLVVSSITGAAAPFSLPVTSATIPAGEFAVFNLLCDGSLPGPFGGSITIATNDADESAVTYNVKCDVAPQALPEFDADPPPRGPITMATTQGTNVSKALTVTNQGNADLQIASATLTGATAQLSVTPSAVVLAPQLPQVFTVTCDAGAEGAYAGELVLTTSDADEPSVAYDVSCGVQAAPAPEFEANPPAGSTLAISTTQGVDGTKTFAVSNLGNQSLSILSASGLAAPFSISPSSAAIAGGGNATFTVTCSGAMAGAFNNGGTPLTLATNDTSEPAVTFPVGCTVAAPVVPEYGSTPPAPGPLTINTSFGTDATTTLTVGNSGNGPLTVSSASGLAPPFSVSPAAATIAPGTSTSFFVRCSGAVAGTFTNSGVALTLATNDASESSVAYGVACNVAELAPDFNSSPAPLTSTIELETSVGIAATKTIEITNAGPVGAGALDIVTSGLSGALSVAPTTASIARAALPQVLTVTCVPSAAGTVTQTLSIASDDEDESPARYTIRCVGSAAEFASVPAADAALVITVPRGETGTGSVRVTNPTSGGGTLQLTASGLSGILSVAPAGATIAPPQIPPTVAYAPSVGATITLTGGAASIVATSNADGSGAPGIAATTTVGSCTITGAGAAAFGTVVLAPEPLVFSSRMAANGTIALACTRAASAASATLTCSEVPGINAPLPRSWPLVCPAL